MNTFFSRRSDPDLYQVIWITLALFLSYLCVAMSLPVTSLYVSSQLDLGNALAGPVTGLLADHYGYAVVFLVGGLAASAGIGILLFLASNDRAVQAA